MTADTITRKKSVTIPANLLAEAEGRTGRRGLSAYVARALATQLEIDRLGDYLAEAEAANGPVPAELREQVLADIAAAQSLIGESR